METIFNRNIHKMARTFTDEDINAVHVIPIADSKDGTDVTEAILRFTPTEGLDCLYLAKDDLKAILAAMENVERLAKAELENPVAVRLDFLLHSIAKAAKGGQ
ncbi:MAG: hypothetical protein CMK92_05270 [Pseudomonas sp.]|nr:hypothetical protein [Pseudomonas sp.]|tara:strand:- start:781 stop:1089 length:309 start_codon:yes stop_codon:yes gene_type:complete